MYKYIYIYCIYILGFDQNSFIRERPFFANKHVTFARLSRTPCLSFAGPVLANNTSYEDSFTTWTCQITPENHGSLLDSLLNMQLASRNPFSGQIVADKVFFGKVYRPTPFNMHFDFRPLFRITSAELLRKYLYTQTPAISRGCIEGKASTRVLGVWLSQSLTFGNLATAFGACFLRLQKASLGSGSGRCKDALQDHGVWLSRSLAFGCSAATYEGCDCPQAPPHRELNQNQTKIL